MRSRRYLVEDVVPSPGEDTLVFLIAVSGGCSVPAACHARIVGDLVVADGVWALDERARCGGNS